MVLILYAQISTPFDNGVSANSLQDNGPYPMTANRKLGIFSALGSDFYLHKSSKLQFVAYLLQRPSQNLGKYRNCVVDNRPCFGGVLDATRISRGGTLYHYFAACSKWIGSAISSNIASTSVFTIIKHSAVSPLSYSLCSDSLLSSNPPEQRP